MASRSEDSAVIIPTEVLSALLSALGDVQKAVGASGTADAAQAATQARVIAALRDVAPYLRELSERRDAAHRADVEAAHERGRLEGLAAGWVDGHRDGHEAGKAAALAERKRGIEALTAPMVDFADTKSGKAAISVVALPVIVQIIRVLFLGAPFLPLPAPAPTAPVEAPNAP